MHHLIIISFISYRTRHGIKYRNDYYEHNENLNDDRIWKNKKTYHNGNQSRQEDRRDCSYFHIQIEEKHKSRRYCKKGQKFMRNHFILGIKCPKLTFKHRIN